MSDRYPELGKQFEINPYPDPTVINDLATSTGMTIIRIKTWFQNHRKKNGQRLKRLIEEEQSNKLFFLETGKRYRSNSFCTIIYAA